MSKAIEIRFVLNGNEMVRSVKPNMVLADFIRYELGLTGTKKGCGKGECGACTVLINGKAVDSCLVLALQVAGKEVTTIEGMSKNEELHPLQNAFVQHAVNQCGYCAPGMLLSAKGLLDEKPNPTEGEVRKAISGNLCRCTGYQKITEAILDAAGN